MTILPLYHLNATIGGAKIPKKGQKALQADNLHFAQTANLLAEKKFKKIEKKV